MATLLIVVTGCGRDRIAALEEENNGLKQKLSRLAAVPDEQIYTLYRSSPFGEARIHVATFDAKAFENGAANTDYTYQICSDGQLNFSDRNRDNSVRFWCEQGRYREKLAIH